MSTKATVPTPPAFTAGTQRSGKGALVPGLKRAPQTNLRNLRSAKLIQNGSKPPAVPDKRPQMGV